MSSSLASIVIPIVVAVALAIWIAAVLHANKHPRRRRAGQPPRREVIGGAFRAKGGRQLMPLPGAEPADMQTPPGGQTEADRANARRRRRS